MPLTDPAYPPELAGRLPLHRGASECEASALLDDQGFETPESWQYLFALSPCPGGTPFFVVFAVRP